MKRNIILSLFILGFATFVWAKTNETPKIEYQKISNAPSLENLRINGIVTYDKNKDVNTFGLYSYSVIKPVQRKEIKLIPGISASGGAIVSDNKLYTYDYAIDYGWVSKASYITYDLKTGEELERNNIGYDLYTAYHHAATAAAKDPTDGNVYCCSYFYDETTKELKYNLSKWNLENMEKDSIAPISVPMRVMACDRNGILYGITSNTATDTNNGGMLVKIDKKNGEITKIGDTGIKPKYFQSAVIDINSNKFYWFANEEDESANLYEVNLNTGNAIKIDILPFEDQVIGAYIPEPEAADGAPSAATNISTEFTDGKLSGIISFDMPSKTYDGNTLTGNLTYKITANNTDIGSGVSNAGSHVEKEINVDNSGFYTLRVTVENESGNSPIAEIDEYIGYDTPLPVNNIVLTREGNVNRLSWDAPQGTVNGGFMNIEELKYKITRMPENIVIEESYEGLHFEETIDKDDLSICYYKIAAVNDIFAGEDSYSNTVTVGVSITPPYVENFDEEYSAELFTIIDSNNDNCTWTLSSKTMRYRASFSNNADDWLITPPVKMVSGQTYNLMYKVYGLSSRNQNKLAVYMGDMATVENMSTIIKDVSSYSNSSSEPIEETIKIIPENDGIYYIGFHIISESGMGNFTIDDIDISKPISSDIPGQATSLSVVPGLYGELTSKVSFTSPTINAGGETLEELTGIEILRNGEVIESIVPETIEPTVYTFNDNLENSGKYIYSIRCVNSFGIGEAISDTAYIGIDIPLNPKSVSLKQNNASAILSWDKISDIGINDGYVNVNAVKYNIYDKSGELIAENIDDMSFIIENIDTIGEQLNIWYSVESTNESGKSEYRTDSNPILNGKSYDTPYNENFADAEFTNGPWENETINGKSYDSKWQARPDQDYTNDGGSADFCGYAKGASSRMTGPKINISGLTNPVLSFWAIIPKGNINVTVSVSLNDGIWQEIGTLGNCTKWTRYYFELKDFKSENMRIAFTGECLNDYHFAYIDNICIDEAPEYDVSINSIYGPIKSKAGISTEYMIELLNNGIYDIESLEVNIKDNNNNILAAETIDLIPALTDSTYSIPVIFNAAYIGQTITLYAELKFNENENNSNNCSENISTFIEGNTFPAVNKLTGKAENGQVLLSWDEPDLSKPDDAIIFEDFESYEPFTINGFGNWTVADEDKGSTYVFGETSLWPNAGQPQAFIVMDTKSEYFTGLNLDQLFGMEYINGKNLAVCWASDPSKTEIGHNDDWLISPLLSGKEQSISFSAKSYSDKYELETFEIYYSNTNNNVTDFIYKIGEESEVSANQWNTFTYKLPEGSKYFAIRCISQNAFMLCIDNIIYYPTPLPAENLEITGYNIYRDNIFIGQSQTNEFTDENPTDNNEYSVSVVYNSGESNMSETCNVEMPVSLKNQISAPIIITENGLSIIGINDTVVNIYDISGIKVLTHKGDLVNYVLPTGFYIIQVYDKNIKIFIK